LLESRWEDPAIPARENRPRRRLYRLNATGKAAVREFREPSAAPAVQRSAQAGGRMRSTVLAKLAIGAVRVWTRLYTWRTQPAVRTERCAEIESDLWESRHDADNNSNFTLRVLARYPR
jgi:DNA-binding PadR family transcriptional regulator